MGNQEQILREQWRALVRGDQKALEWLFDNLSQGLFNFGMKVVQDRELVKDCLQDLFSELWKNRRNLIVPDAPKLYLFKALKYKILRESARQQRRISHVHGFDEAFELSPESVMISDQTALAHRNAIQHALNQLSPRQREVLVLRYFEALSHQEIADMLQINKQSVYNLIFTALGALKRTVVVEVSC